MVLREERLKEGKKEERKTKRGKLLRKMTVKIRLERIDTQEGITAKILLDSEVTELVISLRVHKKVGV